MRHALTILFSVLLAVAPAAGFAGEWCCGVSSSSSSATGADAPAAGDCCGVGDRGDRAPADNGPERDDRPCDGQDCTMMCCSVVKTLCASHRALRPTPASTLTLIAAPPERLDASAHLQRLKRPPRVVTFA